MKSILVAAMTLSLLSGTGVMAQPGTQLRIAQDHNRDRQESNRQDRRDRKAADRKAVDKKAEDLKAAQQKAAEKAATDRRTNNRNAADQKANAQRANDQRARGRRALDQRANDKAVNERRINDQRKANQRAIDRRTNDRNRANRNRQQQNRNNARNAPDRRDNAAQRANVRRWSRGDRLPNQYRQERYYVNDWRQHGLNQPPRGYRWVRDDNNDFFLAAIATGIISTAIYRDDRDQRWNRRYHRTYSYNDDIYYRECRNAPDPAGVLAGALIGGLLGHTASGGRTGATIAGVVVGGAVGAALTSNLNCEDRSYAYKTYYTGFNAGRANRSYAWRNPSNNHRGTFRVGRYYNDPDGFRCATFSQTAYVGNRRHGANGRACRQPDGTWAVVN